jgi:hypothetical protein
VERGRRGLFCTRQLRKWRQIVSKYRLTQSLIARSPTGRHWRQEK